MAEPLEPDLAPLRRRDPAFLSALVKEHTEALLAGALGLGFPPAEAEELVQATFVALLDAAGRFEGRAKLRTYLFGILYNKARDARRKAAREVAEDPTDAAFEARFDARGHWSRPPQGPEDAALAAEAREWISRCAESLSDTQRMAFFLRESEGQSSSDVCNVLGVSATNLRVLLFRARVRLRECLEARWLSR